MKILTIDAKNFIRGQSSTKYINDKGFSPDTDSAEINRPYGSKGILYQGRSSTEYSTNLY